jgi:hypothetical protein
MGAWIMAAFFVLIGPLSYFFGADSRLQSDRASFTSGR